MNVLKTKWDVMNKEQSKFVNFIESKLNNIKVQYVCLI